MFSTRDQKQQQTKTYNEDQLRNVWDKFDQRMKEKEDEFYQKTSNKKLPQAQVDSVDEMMCRMLKQQSAAEIEIYVFDGNQWNSTILWKTYTLDQIYKWRC